MKYDFGTVSERDMDMLFLNAFATDKGFMKLFIGKTDLPKGDYTINEVYLSKADKDGESDITIIIERIIELFVSRYMSACTETKCIIYFRLIEVYVHTKSRPKATRIHLSKRKISSFYIPHLE